MDATFNESLKISVRLVFQALIHDVDQSEISFPSSFSSTERAYVHKLAGEYGLKSRSYGSGNSRAITVYKAANPKTGVDKHAFARIQLTQESVNAIMGLLRSFPVSSREQRDLDRVDQSMAMGGSEIHRPGRLCSGLAQVPPSVLLRNVNPELVESRKQLPIYSYRNQILRNILHHQIVLIVGETGCGKSTQVPQYLLEEACEKGQNVRIFCTEPRRIATLAVAERVSVERGEKMGETVGYQIRLESKVSPHTLLYFCTNGVLVRTLMSGQDVLAGLTHIIIDEVHERDRSADYLITVIKEVVNRYPNLKIILMSAGLDTDHFMRYFPGSVCMQVPGACYEVKQLFLEDVLRMTGSSSQHQNYSDFPVYGAQSMTPTNGTVGSDLCPANKEIDNLLVKVFQQKSEIYMESLYQTILTETVNVNYQHSGNGVTPLMVAVATQSVNYVQTLLELGARVDMKARAGQTAIDISEQFGTEEITELLEAYKELQLMNSSTFASDEGADEITAGNVEQLTEEDKLLLSEYHSKFNDDFIDTKLILKLIELICFKMDQKNEHGAILVFLSGYEEIVTMRDLLLEHPQFGINQRFQLFCLHSNMQSANQKQVFRSMPSGVRKIVLATNIAETSITISDVVYVIDAGKMKEKNFDCFTGCSTLKSVWITKANVKQRMGRAGRCSPGVCFHLFSKQRYHHMSANQIPEIQRMPIHELCLQTKIMAPSRALAEFLSRAPDPPSQLALTQSISYLKAVGALDVNEQLTDLGYHLAELPVEPHLAKMVLFAVVLKCLDPVLTIASCLSYGEPFILPANPSDKHKAKAARKKLSMNTFSDHVVLLRAFQAWQKARTENWERDFCQRNYLSYSSMENIVGIRTQILGHLRAAGFIRNRGAGDIRDLNSNAENWSVVKAALTAGCYPSIALIDKFDLKLKIDNGSTAQLHSSTIIGDFSLARSGSARSAKTTDLIGQLPTDWMVYNERVRLGRNTQLRCVSVVTSLAVAVFGGAYRSAIDVQNATDALSNMKLWDAPSQSASQAEYDAVAITELAKQGRILKIDNWITFESDPAICSMIANIRLKFYALLLRRLRSPSKTMSVSDEAVIQTLVYILVIEEKWVGLVQPTGIGQRPKPMSAEYLIASQTSNGLSPVQTAYASGDSVDYSCPGRSSNNNMNCRVLFSNTRSPQGATSNGKNVFFIVQLTSRRQMDVSVAKKVCATNRNTELKLFKSFRNGNTVYLLFQQNNDAFCGYARMVSTAFNSREKIADFTGVQFGKLFEIQWINKNGLYISQCTELVKYVPFTDGMEVDCNIGEKLLALWDNGKLK